MMKVTETARITPKSMDQMHPDCLHILTRIPGEGLKGRYAPVNVLGSLMYNQETLEPFLDYWVTSKLKMGLSVREQELVILRMAYHYDCNYVWKHHIPVAVEFGVTEEELQVVKSKEIGAVFQLRERIILQLTDEMVQSKTISTETWENSQKTLSASEVVDLISLISQYVLFSLMNNVFRVELEKNLEHIPGI